MSKSGCMGCWVSCSHNLTSCLPVVVPAQQLTDQAMHTYWGALTCLPDLGHCLHCVHAGERSLINAVYRSDRLTIEGLSALPDAQQSALPDAVGSLNEKPTHCCCPHYFSTCPTLGKSTKNSINGAKIAGAAQSRGAVPDCTTHMHPLIQALMPCCPSTLSLSSATIIGPHPRLL